MKNIKSILCQIFITVAIAFIVYLSSCYADFLGLKSKMLEQEKGLDKIERKLDGLNDKVDKLILNFSKVMMYERNGNSSYPPSR